MADDSDTEDKTEAPSAQRLLRAREEGRVPLSREVAGFAVLAVASLVIGNAMPHAVRETTGLLTRLLSESGTMDLSVAVQIAGRSVLTIAAPFVVAAVIVGSLSVLVQTGFLVKISRISPDMSRISPLAGLGRIFGPDNLMEAGKSLLKLAVVGGAGWLALSGALPDLVNSLNWTPGLLAERISAQIMGVLTAMLIAQGVITALDVVRIRLRHNASLRMTKQELRDEFRENDGDPHVKGRLRQLRLQRSRRRMMTAVPKATVVVTNPTHYAVALAYDRAAGGSPRIVAKGVDEVAARIRQVAEAAGVPLVANPPLARALYPQPLDSEIPAEHFKAVAEIIAYVWRLKGRRG
jgi:flagellar biosynthetic protein FlhB